jgi:glycerophosphoryl diester phosphodiesterase
VFSDILDAEAGGRVKVVVSASDSCIDAFRERNGKKYPTGLSNDAKEPSKRDIFEILDRGVDGIMTDRPKSVRAIMDRWIAAQ